MTDKICCRCQFDITATGVKSNLNKNRMPFVDESGVEIRDQISWNRSRDKQRNWETLLQVISLRTLPYDITNPELMNGWWKFEFTVDNISSVELDGDPVGSLRKDVQGVPMIVGLDESKVENPYLITDVNIFFSVADQ